MEFEDYCNYDEECDFELYNDSLDGYPDEDWDALECGFDPYEGCYTFDC